MYTYGLTLQVGSLPHMTLEYCIRQTKQIQIVRTHYMSSTDCTMHIGDAENARTENAGNTKYEKNSETFSVKCPLLTSNTLVTLSQWLPLSTDAMTDFYWGARVTRG